MRVLAGLALALAGGVALVGPQRLIAQIEGDRGIAPVVATGDIEVGGIDVNTTGRTALEAREAGWKAAYKLAWAKTNGPALGEGEIAQLVAGVVVEHEQIGPHRYIARLGVVFDRARAGEIFEIKTRPVTIYSLAIVEEEKEDPHPGLLPRAGEAETTPLTSITLSATVSKGTYIRSLARDIARALGTVGHVTMLRRTKAGPFTLDPAISLDKLEELAKGQRLDAALLPLTAGLDDIPALSVTPDQARALREGRRLIGIAAPTGLNLAIDGSTPVALVEADDREVWVVRGFNLMSKEDE